MNTLTLIEKVGKTGWDSKTGSFIQFKKDGRLIQGRLMQDYNEIEDGIFWVMQRTHCIKAEYTAQDVWENKKYNEAPVLTDGETVEIWKIRDHGEKLEDCGIKQYRFKALGDYSDCAIFETL